MTQTKKLKFNNVNKEGYNPVLFDSNLGLTLSIEPTHNCQLAILGGAERILYNNVKDNTWKREIFEELFEHCSKNIILVDVYHDAPTNFWPKDHIISEQYFTSTNGSKRKIVMFADLDWFPEDDEDDEYWDDEDEEVF